MESNTRLETSDFGPNGVPGIGRRSRSDREDRWTNSELTDSSTASKEIKTGTTTVGAVGADGVVLAADRRASLSGQFVTNQSARKIEPVDDRTAVAFSGSVSDAQSFVRQLRAELRQYEFRHGDAASVETAATVAGDLVRRGPYRILDLVLAGVDDDPAVYQIGGGGSVMDTAYAASGSGMQLAYGSLEGAYEPDLPLADLRRVVAAAVQSATERDTASGDGMTIATIAPDSLDLEQFDDIAAAVASTAAIEGDSRPNPDSTSEEGR
ncbi:proteasome subunit alpha [Natronorubrum sp. FCH18a]|uniref:proteasome subunit alpha n=1 Tax=Natronorubrum sp. FCH18a TaxID=3447018 RepID=UPI003F5187E3